MIQLVAAAALAVLLAQSAPVAAPQAAAPEAAAPAPIAPAPAPGMSRLPVGLSLQVELVEALSSKTSHAGQRFAIRLAEPILADGVVVVPAGALGEGEVIDAAHNGMSGGQGKLLIAARSLQLGGRSVKVRGMTVMAAGASRVGLAQGLSFVPYVGLGAGLIRGGEIEIPAGTKAVVRLAEAVDLPLTPPDKTEEQK